MSPEMGSSGQTTGVDVQLGLFLNPSLACLSIYAPANYNDESQVSTETHTHTHTKSEPSSGRSVPQMYWAVNHDAVNVQGFKKHN